VTNVLEMSGEMRANISTAIHNAIIQAVADGLAGLDNDTSIKVGDLANVIAFSATTALGALTFPEPTVENLNEISTELMKEVLISNRLIKQGLQPDFMNFGDLSQ
jgi:hypothetical protein